MGNTHFGGNVFANKTVPVLTSGATQSLPTNTKVAVSFGNSFETAGNISQISATYYYTNRDAVYTCLSTVGAPFRLIRGFGQDGDTSTGIKNRFKNYLASGAQFDWTIIYGFLANDAANGISVDTSNANALEIVQTSIAAGKPVLWFMEPITDTTNTGFRRSRYFGHINYMRELGRTTPGLYIVPIHETYNPKGNSTLVTKDFAPSTDNGLHPTAVGVQGMTHGAKKVLSKLFTESYSPFTDNKAYTNVTFNPFLAGNNTNGSGSSSDGWWFRSGGAATTGPGPNSYAIGVTGGVSVAVSKVAHPVLTGWGAGEAVLPCVQLSATCTGSNGSFIFSVRDTSVVSWTSNRAIAGPYNQIRPTVPNGCLYRPLTSGNLSAAGDPTGGWSTTLGDEFTDGNVTLQVIQDWSAGNVLVGAYADLYFTAYTGRFALPQIDFGVYDSVNAGAGVTINGSNGAYTGLRNVVGSGNSPATLESSYGANLGLNYIDPHMVVRTRYDDSVPIPFTPNGPVVRVPDQIKLSYTQNMAVGSTMTVVIPQFGASIMGTV